MLNTDEIITSLSGLEAYFKGEGKHIDSGLALADADALEEEFLGAARGVARRDKGAREIYRHPKAPEALALVSKIRQAITTLEPVAGLAACDDLRQLANSQHWI